VCRPKHVEHLRNIGIINSTTRLHLVGSFYEFYITMHGYMNIKLQNFVIFLKYTFSKVIFFSPYFAPSGGKMVNIKPLTIQGLVVCHILSVSQSERALITFSVFNLPEHGTGSRSLDSLSYRIKIFRT
jgi:hypothetical protein